MNAITEKQLNFIERLSGEREVPVAGRTAQEANTIARWEDSIELASAVQHYGSFDVALSESKFVNRREASQVIDFLLSLPKKQVEQQSADQPEIGVYVLPNGTIVQAKPNKAKTNVYTKRWVTIGGERLVDATEEHVHGEWEYAPELKREIRPEYKMTLEQAKDFILRYGQCARCGRRLKAAESVERGIGPVCQRYFSFAA